MSTTTAPDTARSTGVGGERFVQARVALDERPFLDPVGYAETWGGPWGAINETGTLASVLLRRPGYEFDQVDPGLWDEDLAAAFDPDDHWYWLSRDRPDVSRMQQQHDGLVQTLTDLGVQTHVLDPIPHRAFSKSVYTRDPVLMVPGGAVVGRLAAKMRRGEERDLTQYLAGLGMPILGTIVGSGFVEGGSFCRLTPTLSLFGTARRCNAEGAQQLREILARLGVTLIDVPLSGFSLHLDGALAMLAPDLALVLPERLPHWLPDLLRENGITPVWADPAEPWSVNLLPIAPGHVLMSSSSPRTEEALTKLGINVTTVDYDAVQANGGGVHCSTQELFRAAA